jgi:AraC-like DNA-binding protein
MMMKKTVDTQSDIRAHAIAITGALRPYVSALVATDISKSGPFPLAIVPHERFIFSVQTGRAPDAVEERGALGENTRLTGIRHWTGAFTGAGNCVSMFALLTPLGSVHLLESQPLNKVPRIQAQVADLLDRKLTQRLESDIAVAASLDAKLLAFAAWLEARATSNRRITRAALRAGHAAMRVCDDPMVSIDALANEQHISRRQLERDFSQWIGTSPRHLAQVARVQAVSRKAQAGASFADIANDVGFADQAHMSHVVRELTGLTPRQFTHARPTGLASAFRHATGGGTVYL